MTAGARIVVSAALLIGALLVVHLRSAGEAVPIRRPLDSFPSTIGVWQSRGGTILPSEILEILKAKDYVERRYENPVGRSLWLFIGYWDSQRKGAQPHSPKNCLPGGGWEPLEASQLTIPLPSPFAPIVVNRYVIQKDRDQQVVFYWYQAQGKAVAGELQARVEMVQNSVFRHRTDGALVRISSPVYGSVKETSDLVTAYIQAMYPILGEYLPD